MSSTTLIRRSAATAAATAALLGGALVPSAAAEDHTPLTAGEVSAAGYQYGPWYSADKGRRGASAYFTEHGDRAKVCDRSKDGYAAVIEVWRGKTATSKAYWAYASGAGDCTSVDAHSDSWSNLKEDRWYSIRACRLKSFSNLRPTNCGSFHRVYNNH